MITDKHREIIRYLQGDLPIQERPYAEIAAQLEITEEELLQELSYLKEQGYLRRVGAILYHYKAGINHNALVAWKITESKIEDIGEIMANSSYTTHVYQRQSHPEWPYNLYTMIHGKDREDCLRIARELSQAAGEDNYTLLFSSREFKKTSMQYY